MSREQSSEFENTSRQTKSSEGKNNERCNPMEEGDNVTDGQRADIIRFEHCLKNMAELLDLTASAPRK